MPMIPKINDRGEAWDVILDFLTHLQWRGRIDLPPYHRLGLGKYRALNRDYNLDPSLKADMEMVRKRQEQLQRAGFCVHQHGG